MDRIVVSPSCTDSDAIRDLSFGAVSGADGRVVARSRSSETSAVRIAGVALHVKRYVYSIRQTVRGALRNTLLRPSRVAREFATLRMLEERIGPDRAVRPAMFGERRRLGFLRDAFLATETLLDAVPVNAGTDPEAIGRFIRSLHERGFHHGRLYARNLLVLADGSLRIVDPDRSRWFEGGVRRPAAAWDFACLIVSVPGLPIEPLVAGGRHTGLRDEIEAALPAAREGLERRAGPPRV